MINLGKHVRSDIFLKIDASLLLVWFSIIRDALAGITGNGRPVAVLVFTWLILATGLQKNITIISLWTLVLKQNGNKIVIKIMYKLMWDNKEFMRFQ